MIGRSMQQDTAQPVRDGRSLLGASTLYDLDKAYPSKRYPQTPPPAGPPWTGLRGINAGGLAAAPRAAMVNVENMLPVIVVRQAPALASGKHNQLGLMNRLRSSYALLPLGSSSQ
ncbi:MAG TPA: hypothetical protein VJX92_15545 [Methylomirabilota bacterium]|nr:hypothetical protein [Methylomirabilota bacterium]